MSFDIRMLEPHLLKRHLYATMFWLLIKKIELTFLKFYVWRRISFFIIFYSWIPYRFYDDVIPRNDSRLTHIFPFRIVVYPSLNMLCSMYYFVTYPTVKWHLKNWNDLAIWRFTVIFLKHIVLFNYCSIYEYLNIFITT